MAKRTCEIGTLTLTDVEINSNRYKKCGLLNIIQHIDYYGNMYSKIRGRNDKITMSSISCSPSKLLEVCKEDLEAKLSKFSVRTKVSELYPGNDILSKNKKYKIKSKSNFVMSNAVMR